MHRRHFGEMGAYHEFRPKASNRLFPLDQSLKREREINFRVALYFIRSTTFLSQTRDGRVGVKCGIFPRWSFVRCCLALVAAAKQSRLLRRSNYGRHRISWLVRDGVISALSVV
jgi:hypothetical protein